MNNQENLTSKDFLFLSVQDHPGVSISAEISINGADVIEKFLIAENLSKHIAKMHINPNFTYDIKKGVAHIYLNGEQYFCDKLICFLTIPECTIRELHSRYRLHPLSSMLIKALLER